MIYVVYKIVNKLDSKIYIGKHQTKDLNDDYMGSGKHLKNAQRKYGIENFEKEILFQFDNEADMNAKEAELVTEEFCLREDTYNLCPGGKGGWGYINQNKLSTSFSSYIGTPKHKFTSSKGGKATGKQNISEAHQQGKIKYDTFTGRTHTEDTKIKISIAMKDICNGEKNSQFGTMWITNGTENKKIKKIDSIPEGWYKGRKFVPIAQR